MPEVDPSRGSGDLVDRILSGFELKMNQIEIAISKLESSLTKSGLGQVLTTSIGPGGAPARVKIASENSARTGAVISNQGGSKVLIFFGASDVVVLEVSANSHVSLPIPCFVGDVFAARLSGTNPVVFTELVSVA